MKNECRNVALTVALIMVAGCSSSSKAASTEPAASGAEDPPTTLTTAPDGTPVATAGTNQLWMCPRPGLAPTLTGSTAPWVSGTTIDLSKVPFVTGSVSWQSQFSMTITDAGRVLVGNGLPNHPTGQFPVDSSTEAYTYYSALPAQGYANAAAIPIAPYDINLTLPVNPTPNPTPTCVSSIFMGVVSQTGGAWHAEIAPDSMLKLHDPLTALPLDDCYGHPYNTQYHYHAYSWKCFPNQGDPSQHSPLFGYAIDGFGVFGPHGENGTLVTNSDLDECHGHTHEIEWDGAMVSMYHYHLNNEYPYSIGCFRGRRSHCRRPYKSRPLLSPIGPYRGARRRRLRADRLQTPSSPARSAADPDGPAGDGAAASVTAASRSRSRRRHHPRRRHVRPPMGCCSALRRRMRGRESADHLRPERGALTGHTTACGA